MKKKFGTNYKHIVRDEVASLVKPNMTIFSLPYLNFQIEKNAKVAHCCEKDTLIWAEQTKVAPENCVLYNKLASEVIGIVPFDLVFLDLCGSISNELFKCIQRVNLKNKSSKFIVTLLKAREHRNFKEEIAQAGGRFPFLQKKLEENDLYVYKSITYFDSSPMMVLFASRTKKKKIDTISYL